MIKICIEQFINSDALVTWQQINELRYSCCRFKFSTKENKYKNNILYKIVYINVFIFELVAKDLFGNSSASCFLDGNFEHKSGFSNFLYFY